MATVPPLEGHILSLWRRDSERNSDHKQASELSYGVFHRERQASVRLDRDGIVDSHEYHRTEGNLEEINKSGGTPAANVGERAFCVQSLPQIDQLCRDFPEFSESMSVPCAWGENATIGGPLACTTVCVGDIFHVFGPGGVKRSLELEVASPRRPCSNVDKRHGKRYNQRGVRAHTARTGLAGWFYRVLEEGDISEGDTLRLVERPNPAWLLSRVAHLVYSEAVNGAYDIPRWPGTRAELYALQALPQLALIEWRDTCDKLVERDRQGKLSTTAEEFRMLVAQALGATACAGLAVAMASSKVLGQWAKRSV